MFDMNPFKIETVKSIWGEIKYVGSYLMSIRGFSEISPSTKPSHFSCSSQTDRALHRHCLLQSILHALHVPFVEQYFSQNFIADAASGMLSLGNGNSFRTWVSLFLHLKPFSDRMKSFCDTVKNCVMR